MSNVYIISAVKSGMGPGNPSVVLKLSSGQQVKNIYRSIKAQLPQAHLGIFEAAAGSGENQHQEKAAKHSHLVYEAADFVHAVRALEINAYCTRIAL